MTRDEFLDQAYFEGRMSGHIRPGGGIGTHPSFRANACMGDWSTSTTAEQRAEAENNPGWSNNDVSSQFGWPFA